MVEVIVEVCVYLTKVPIDVGSGGAMCLCCIFRLPHGAMRRNVGAMSIHVDVWDVILMARWNLAGRWSVVVMLY